MLRHLFLVALASSLVIANPTASLKDLTTDTEDAVESLQNNAPEEPVLVLNKPTDDGSSTVEVIELSPELESLDRFDEDMMEEVVEFIQITPDGEEYIEEMSIRELIEEQEEFEEEDNIEVGTESTIEEVEMSEVKNNPTMREGEETDELGTIQEILEEVRIDEEPLKQLHKDREIIITKDNIFRILKTLIVASTHKESPTYQEILKAGAISALKTSMTFMGKEKLSNNIIQLVKEYTNYLDQDPSSEEEESLALLAEEYLQNHKFKIMLPESIILHQPEMEQFIAKKSEKESMRGLFSDGTEYSISMPRSDPAVTTLLSIGPMTWLAVLGSLFTIPYFLSDDETQRSDQPRIDGPILIRPPGLGLRAPPPAFQRHPQLIHHPQGKPVQVHHREPQPQPQRDPQHIAAPTPAPGNIEDPDYQEYLREYDQWYKQWYHYYYVQQFEEQPPQQGVSGSVPHVQIVDPQQNPTLIHDPVNPHSQNGENNSFRHATKDVEAPDLPPNSRLDSDQPAPINALPQNNLNEFGSFIPNKQRVRNSHFGVSQIDNEGNISPITSYKRPAGGATSPKPVYRPGLKAPTTELGFQPVSDTRERPVISGPTPKPEIVGGFSAPKSNSLLNKQPPAPVNARVHPTVQNKDSKKKIETSKIPKRQQIPSRQPETASQVQPSALVRNPPLTAQIVHSVTNKRPATPNRPAIPNRQPENRPGIPNRQPEVIDTQFGNLVTSSGFKPIVPLKSNTPAPVVPPRVKPHAPVLPPRVNTPAPVVSAVTSGVFKTTSQPTVAAATTPTASAVFVKDTSSSQLPSAPAVRVVTSTSVVTSVPFVANPTSPQPLPDLRRPQRHQLHSPSRPQQSLQQANSLRRPTNPNPGFVKPSNPNTEFVKPNNPNTGFVKTNIPTKVKVVKHTIKYTNSPTTAAPTTTPSSLPIYALDPFYGPRLSRVDAIFHQLSLEKEGCREQVVCNMYKNPNVYTPLSDFLSRQLTVTMEELQRPKVSDPRILRFFRYLQAAKNGQDGNDCVSKYPECPTDTTRLSHKPIMDAFKKVSILMNQGTTG